MKKAIVIGSPGAGKSTFARRLSGAVHLPLYYLDMLWHRPDRTTVSQEVFDRQLDDILRQDRWILDGTYLRTLERRLEACDTVFLLDFPPQVCLSGAQARIGKKRENLPWVESEFDAEFKQWILDFPTVQLPQVYALLESCRTDKTLIVFKSRKEADDYLNHLFSDAFCQGGISNISAW